MRVGRRRRCLRIGLAALWVGGIAVCVARAGEPEVPPQQVQTAPANPLSNLLKKVFGAAADGERSTPDARVEPQQGDRQARSSDDARQFAHAEKAAASGDWHHAVRLLQEFLDRPHDAAWELTDGGRTSLQTEAEARIGRLPPAGLHAYRTEYEALAGRLLAEAERTGDLERLAQVAARYFHTDAGNRAAETLAQMLFDRGASRAAAAWFGRLAHAPAFRQSRDAVLRAAYSLMQSGRHDEARTLLESLGPGALPGGVDARLREWIAAQPERFDASPVLDDWPMLYGTAAHVGTASGVVPLLLPRWSQPLTARFAIEQQLRDLLLDIGDNQRAAITAWLPIVVDGRVACRTFRGLAVFNAEDGELLWESDTALSAERLLAGEPPDGAESAFDFSGRIVDYAYNNFEQHQLTGLLFRDAGYGLLSSDGRRVFSIEHSVLMPPMGYSYWWGNNDPSSEDPYQRDWSSNQIHAFDLATGEQVWEVGGRRMDEPFDRPLSGVFFFGPPVAEGEELFAVGERDNEISLFVLSASTGELRWSQPLADAGTAVQRDFVRRLWACPPAVDEGVVVCPTTAGWLVAVDRQTHRIVWAHRYAARTEGVRVPGGAAMHALQPLNERWCPAAPILSGGRVVFTPSEQPDETGQDQPRILCLDATTGKKLWDHAKGNLLYVAGVFGGRVVAVGKREIVALSLERGEVLWQLPIPQESGPPSGRGVAAGEAYLLPLQSGELWTIALADGRFVRRVTLPSSEDRPPLGNLVLYRGMLLSLGPFALVGFEEPAALERQIAERTAADPNDLWSAVRQAEMLLVASDFAAALAALDRAASATEADPALRERHRRLTFTTLLSLIRQESDSAAGLSERAAALAADAAERLEFDCLEVQRLIRVREWQVAWRLCTEMAGRHALDRPIDAGQTTVRLDAWLGGRFREIDAQAPPDVRAGLANHITQALGDGRRLEDPLPLERMYGFHPAAQAFVWEVIERAAARKEFAAAEVRLRRLIQGADRAAAAAALQRLGELLLEYDQPADAAACFARLEQDLGDADLPDGRTGAEAAAAAFRSGRVSREALRPPRIAAWSGQQFAIQHYRVVNADYSSPQSPVLRCREARFFRDHHLQFDAQSPLLSITRQGDGGEYWRVPLRAAESQAYNQSAAVIAHGLQMMVMHRGMLHALSLADRRVLWSRLVSERGPGLFTRHIYDSDLPTLQTANGFAARAGLSSVRSPTGMLGLATAHGVVCHGRGEFLLLDPLTGEVLWRRRGVAPQTALYGNGETIYVVTPNPDESYALRTADGSPVPLPGLAELVKSSVALSKAGFVQIDRRGSRRDDAAPAVLTVRAVDPHRRGESWSRQFEAASRMVLLDDRTLLVLEETSGVCSLVELDSGAVQQLGDVRPDLVRQASEIIAVADAEQVYLIVNHLANRFIGYMHPPAARVSGTVVALPRSGGGAAWEQRIENQTLLLAHFEQSPLMVFLTYEHVHLREIEADYANAHLIVVDKGTGRIVAREQRPSPSGSYYRIDFSRAQRAIDIHSHNERIRIQAVSAGEWASERR